MSPKWIPIRYKVALIICLVSGVSFSLFFTLNFRDTIDRIQTHTHQLIARNHQVHARHIEETLVSMQRDSEAISGFPPISGLVRTLPTRRLVDPQDGSTLDQLRKRLETLFVSMIASREGYSQIRLILAKDNWREFTRVDMIDGKPRITAWSDLQQKGDEPYIKALMAEEDTGFQFSNVTRNRELGIVTGPPTIRSMRPVRNADGTLIGAIVVNAVIDDLLRLPKSTGQIGSTFYEVENKPLPGTSLPAEETRFLVHPAGAETMPAQSELEMETYGTLVTLDGQDGLFVTEVALADLSTPFAIRVATVVDMHALYSAARSELGRNIFNALVLTFLASSIGYVLTARLLQPLQDLLDDISTGSTTLQPINATFKGEDEVAFIGQRLTKLTNELIRETRRLDMILDNVAEGVVTLLSDGRIEDLNPAAERILGQTARDLTGRDFVAILGAPEILSKETLQDLAFQTDTESAPTLELRMRPPGAQDIMLQIRLRHAQFPDGTRFILMLRDVTARTRAAEQSEALIAALKRSNAELDQFAYVASHDLKAPLRVISNAVTWLEEDLEPYLTDDTRESMRLLQSRTSRMERLLNDLLQHSRIGRVAEPSTEVSGQDMADDLLELLEIPQGMRVDFSADFLKLRVRKLPLETVLVNLIGNGIRHHDRTEGRVHVDVTPEANGLRFQVSDDGPGIDPAYHDRIFEVFQTLKSRDQLDSSGMGLAFVKKHIEVVGGEIRVISDGTRGSTFEFLWPIGRTQNKAA